MSRIRYILAVGFLTLFVAGAAHAQTETSTTSTPRTSGFGIGAHYSWLRNQETEESANMFGVMARLRGKYVGVEGAIDYRNEDMGGDVELKSWPISASLMIYPIPFAYGLAGLGWYNTTLDFPDGFPIEDQTDTQLGYHLGAGVEVPVAPTFALTADFRYLFVDYEFDEIPENFGENADALSINGGVIFYLK